MQYRQQCTQALFKEVQANNDFVKTYDDVLCGAAYLDAVCDQKILLDNILLICCLSTEHKFTRTRNLTVGFTYG